MDYFEATRDKDGKFNWEGHYRWYVDNLHKEFENGGYSIFTRDVGSCKAEENFTECFIFECGITANIPNSQLACKLKWDSDNLNDVLNNIYQSGKLSREEFASLVKLYQKMRVEFRKRFKEHQDIIDRDCDRQHREKQPAKLESFA